MDNSRKPLRHHLSPYLRGGIYYAVHFTIVSVYFSYVNVAYIERGISGVQLGTLSAVGSVLMLIASPLLTGLADRKGWHLAFLALGNLIFGLSVIGINFAYSFPLLLLVTSVGGFFKAPANPIGDGLVIRMANKHHINFGQMRVWGSLSFAVFCLLAGRLWDLIGLEWLFWIGGSLFFLRALMAVLLDPPEKQTGPQHTPGMARGSLLTPLKDRLFFVYLAAMVLWGCAMNGFGSYISIYIKQLTNATTLVGLAVALPALAEIPTVYLGERFIRRFGPLPILMFAIALTMMVSALTAFLSNPALIIALNALRGFGLGFFIVVGVRYVDSRAPSDQVGTYQSLSGVTLYTIPSLVFMPLLGYVYDTYSVNATFLVSSAMGVLALLVLARLQRMTVLETRRTARPASATIPADEASSGIAVMD
ncbi:MAG: MFS transporter [Anaerolineae bacterium]|nr:MFS transporter [Anaerolineae bacterium]